VKDTHPLLLCGKNGLDFSSADMPSELNQPIQLLPIFRERVWGRETLAPYFPEIPGKQRIGEIWFTFEENSTSTGQRLGELIQHHPEILGTAADPKHPAICPLLVKLLFTSERLSVQVHPDDDYAQLHHRSLGKTEAWYVLDAEPPGELAVGFRETLTPEKFKAAIRSGEIERLLAWRKVSPGEAVFVPAGTVHAIGAGLTICEIQESSDITYRLYDYGRSRELHLEHGVNVSNLEANRPHCKLVALADWRDQLIECRYFRIERLRPRRSMRIEGGVPYYLLLVCVRGSGSIGGQPFAPGQAWLLPAHSAAIEIEGLGSEWLLAYTADRPTSALQESSQQ